MPAILRFPIFAVAVLLIVTGCSTSKPARIKPHWRPIKLGSGDGEVSFLTTRVPATANTAGGVTPAAHQPDGSVAAQPSDTPEDADEERVILMLQGTPPNEDDLEPFCALFPGATVYTPSLKVPPVSFKEYRTKIEVALAAIRRSGVNRIGILGFSDGGRALFDWLETDPELALSVEFVLAFGAKFAPRAELEFAPGERSLIFWRWLPSSMLRAFMGEEKMREGVAFSDPTLTETQLAHQVSELMEVNSRPDVPRASARITADELRRKTAFVIPPRFRGKTRLILAEKDGLATPETQEAPAREAGISVRVLPDHGHFFLDLDAEDGKRIKEDLTDW